MTLHLFEGYGIELEYMIVDATSLDVLPVSDRVLGGESEIEAGPLCWSNELVLHVIELKTNGPTPALAGLEKAFQAGVREVNRRLAPLGGRLMPTAMHPWMDPHRETRLWPHENGPIYGAYNRIFGCRGHGWANLQSAHINLPFCGDAEFGRLHAAIRLLLPVLPALAASSPVLDGAVSPLLDTRLHVYRGNQSRILQVTGRVVPEPVFTRADYEAEILAPMYRAIAPHDPEGTLQYEWLNSRGAIARFERDAIEIRVLDVQECPAADLAVARLIAATLQGLAAGRWADDGEQRRWDVEPLATILDETIHLGEEATLPPDYLALFAFPGRDGSAGDLWRHLAERLRMTEDPTLNTVLERGPLARRIRRAVGPAPSRERLAEVYGELCACLAEGRMFHG